MSESYKCIMWIIRQWRWQSISLLIRKMQMQQSNNGLVSIFSFWLHFEENHNKTPSTHRFIFHQICPTQFSQIKVSELTWKKDQTTLWMHHRHRHHHACMYYACIIRRIKKSGFAAEKTESMWQLQSCYIRGHDNGTYSSMFKACMWTVLFSQLN